MVKCRIFDFILLILSHSTYKTVLHLIFTNGYTLCRLKESSVGGQYNEQ